MLPDFLPLRYQMTWLPIIYKNLSYHTLAAIIDYHFFWHLQFYKWKKWCSIEILIWILLIISGFEHHFMFKIHFHFILKAFPCTSPPLPISLTLFSWVMFLLTRSCFQISNLLVTWGAKCNAMQTLKHLYVVQRISLFFNGFYFVL